MAFHPYHLREHATMTADTLPSPSVSSPLKVQCRVIAALILREVHTLYGNTKLGYLWAVIQTAFGIGVFWAFRELMGAHAPHGTGMAVFLLCGFIPWYIFSDTVNRCMKAASANQALLTFPQVTELDLMLGRLVVVWGTQVLSAGIILSVAAACGQAVELRDPASLTATLFFAPLLGLGLGLIFASLARFWPTLDKLIPMCLRILFLASGVFFYVSELPGRLANILLLNPVAQLIEWQRYGFSASSAAPAYNIVYISAWCATSLSIGLLLERYARRRGL
ncbi:ABC transporter permease [Nitratidesulfovibrio vulgaris]|uniref:ABC-2 type transporter n=1 Tax=Nitratidesulfovibrio vulgaris (strain DP4) TaxID=391774 RepID=A0A0H3ACR7_NITV4|nr:ABC transporter permease [Nitratidesulfovibrio vulgaris]ABM29596.1 ABC-2 type transporter [Nitratidesulfovibrio vulgaris DP4]